MKVNAADTLRPKCVAFDAEGTRLAMDTDLNLWDPADPVLPVSWSVARSRPNTRSIVP